MHCCTWKTHRNSQGQKKASPEASYTNLASEKSWGKDSPCLAQIMDGFLCRIVIKLFELFGVGLPIQKRFQHLCLVSKHIHPMQ